MIYYDLDLFRQNVEVFFSKFGFQCAKWNRKNENAEIRIPLPSVLATWKKDIPQTENYRSSHWRCSVKKGVLNNFANLTRKHLCWMFLLIKLQSWGSLTWIKRGSNTGVFPMKFAKVFRTYILKNICQRPGPSTLLKKRKCQIFSDVGGPTMVGSNVAGEILKKWPPRLAKSAFPRTNFY